MSSKTSLLSLPDDVIFLIILELPVKLAMRICHLNKRFNQMVSSEMFWRTRIIRDFSIPKSKIRQNSKIFYQLLYYKGETGFGYRYYNRKYACYLVHILYFILDTRRKDTLVYFTHSRYKDILFRFCEVRGLKCESGSSNTKRNWPRWHYEPVKTYYIVIRR